MFMQRIEMPTEIAPSEPPQDSLTRTLAIFVVGMSFILVMSGVMLAYLAATGLYVAMFAAWRGTAAIIRTAYDTVMFTGRSLTRA